MSTQIFFTKILCELLWIINSRKYFTNKKLNNPVICLVKKYNYIINSDTDTDIIKYYNIFVHIF